jgi:hypothetical protein
LEVGAHWHNTKNGLYRNLQRFGPLETPGRICRTEKLERRANAAKKMVLGKPGMRERKWSEPFGLADQAE